MLKNNKQIILLSILNIFSSILILLIAYNVKLTIDYASVKNIEAFKYSLIFLTTFILLEIIFKISYKYLFYYFFIKDVRILKEEIYLKILKDNNSRTLTDYLTCYNDDLNNIISYKLKTIPQIIYNIHLLVGSLILLLINSYKIFIILVIIILLILIIGIFYLRTIKERIKDRQNKQARLSGYLKDSINNKLLCNLYESYDKYNNIFNKHNNNYIKSLKKEGLLFTTSSSIIYIFSQLILLTLLIICNLLVIKEAITIGQIALLIQLLSYIINPIFTIPSMINLIGQAKASYDRLNFSQSDNIINKLDDFDSIILDNISFKYEDKDIIKNLNYKINNGDLVKISGESGSGKSTLIKLLLGVFELTSGNIYVIKDNKKYDINKIYHLMAYLPQELILFNEDIRTNFNLYTCISDNKIYELLRLVRLDDRIKDLELNINDTNSNLSTGEKARLSLAIALSLNKEILILDEYNSALDKDNSNVINEILNKLNKTIIYINHRDEYLNNSKELIINE